MDEKYTVTRITRKSLEALRKLAAQDHRNQVWELDWLIELEVERRQNVIKVEELPHPPDGEVVPLVYLKG